MRAINRFQVMDAIRRHGPISRVEIAGKTELSPTTVSSITSTLLGDNLIVPAQDNPVADGGLVPRDYGIARDHVRGRPRVMLALNPEAAFVAGIKLAPDQITVAVTDFRARVLNTLSLPVEVNSKPLSTIADLVSDGVERCVQSAGLSMADIRGVCVGLPGVIEHSSGICRQSSLFKEPNAPLAAELEKRLAVKAALDTDANLITLAESWFGHGRGMDDFMVVSIEQNLGLGIMHQGELFRGANGLCPDLGDLLVYPRNENSAQRLADLASVEAMLVAAGIWAKDKAANQKPRIAEAVDLLVERAGAGDELAIRTLDRAGRALGAAIASLTILFAPPSVILAGVGIKANDFLLGPLREVVAQDTPASLSSVTQITAHEWSDDTWARGAAAMTLKDLYGMPWDVMVPVMRI